jgi:hypothetical protein
MNPVRLDIIQDDAAAAPRLSRTLPAVLYNIVPESSYADFCNKIDPLLSLAADDYKIRARRNLWSNYGAIFWMVWFLICFIGSLSHSIDGSSVPDQYFYITVASFAVGLIYMVIMRIWMNTSTGVTPAAQTMQTIRDECAAMTKRTPHASFHVVLTPLATALRAHHLHANPIACIEVSVSVIGFELARANGGMTNMEMHHANGTKTADTSHPAVSTTSPVTSDYLPMNIV